MGKRGFQPEQIIAKLREAEVLLSNGQPVEMAVRQIGVTEQTYYHELLNGEIFTTLLDAKVLIENWRNEYNHIRPQSSLGFGTISKGVRYA